MSQSKLLTIYFYSIIAISIAITFSGNEKINIYGPVLYMIFGFPFLFGLFYLNLYQFSIQLKRTSPDLFKKYSLNYTRLKGKMITTNSLFHNNDFKSIEIKALREKYFLTKKIFYFAVLSFFLIIPIALGLILLK